MTITDTSAVDLEVGVVPSWRPFRVWVSRLQRLSPTFLRITFTGDDLEQFGHDGPDQRIKLCLPAAGQPLPNFSVDDWYADLRAADPNTRGALRTYTIRAVRPELREVDVDFVLHGDSGPASSFALHATLGQEIALVGPNRRFDGDALGYEWSPPAGARTLLLAGDETAVPAIAGILETLSADSAGFERILVLVEVPEPDDALPLRVPANAELHWLPRVRTDGSVAPNGELLVDAVRRADLTAAPASTPSLIDTVDIDLHQLWEVADSLDAERDDLYAWVAGEAGSVKAIRRYLVRERGVERKCVSFMGYWRVGRSEN